MKRGTPDHPKTLALQAALRCSRPAAVGLLELLWHWTARYAPAGDVGRWSNGALAQAVGWDGDADALVAALVAAGWLDERPECRLYVHDWSHHADDAVKLALYRATKTFADGSVPVAHRLSAKERERLEGLWAQRAHNVPTECVRQCAQPEPRQSPALAPPEPRQSQTDLAAPDGTARTRAARETWLTPYCEAWAERWGSESKPPGGEMARALREAEKRLGGDVAECVARWRRFLAAAEQSQFARPARFLQGLGEWADGKARASPRRGVTAGNVEAAKRFLGASGGDGGE